MAGAAARTDLPPSRAALPGAVDWLRNNLFSSWLNAFLTVASLWLVWSIVVPVFDWAIVRGVFEGHDRSACVAADAGACWPYLGARMGQFVYGFYDIAQRWRVDIVYVLGTVGVLWLAIPNLPAKRWAAAFMLVIYPLVTYGLLSGGFFGLPIVQTAKWGGLLMTLVVAVTGIVVSLPLGILLALGRRSEMPVIRWLCIIFIEVVRGVPLVTVLFMASNLLPLFLPEGWNPDKLFRALVAVALFSAAYMAEVVRGGLQAVPRGQYEASSALGFGYWRTTAFIVMPQALKIVMPSIVNTFISLFKDTTLVSIIGFFDLLGIVQAGNSDPNWSSPNTPFTGYAFAAVVFWAFCFSMSRYSAWLERRVGGGKQGMGRT